MTILAALSTLANPTKLANNARLSSNSGFASAQGSNSTASLLDILSGLNSKTATNVNANIPGVATANLTATTDFSAQ
ncbi:hypothetical protein SAMD00019534_025330 [Acytostelium subglobosum LB1]|uniref:hypothetical protein n=1 Tax=Acytostelium subglobosum LB1 TaxID=1410327 RepID=UPI000644CF39|nr:hypothetical protein SAMD00019534_025330 [Acytostelium subglobosum LB1]GAM19358.1 hypothetical protein SAMD00019534_025330 [Acytostelium subglobosum LB1]|eukprot:XP_012757285.1 hypothetical protein SAMD00019534_025330 [Acytostelium subglobosum LB1]